MKICYLAASESIHTKRWCEHFLSKNHNVYLISFKKECDISGVKFYFVDAGNLSVKGGNWNVLLKANEIKSIVRKIKPDIVHSHYATSYGIVGALVNYHPYVITALGSDILISPNNSIIYRKLLKFAFKRADWITVMANHMKLAMLNIGNFDLKTEVVPFGIDTNLFNANNRKVNENHFVITSTRNFEDVYNIPHLLNALSKIKSQIPNLRLNLIGGGSKREFIEKLVKELGLTNFTKFYGKIPQSEMVKILNKSHVFVSVSLSDGNNISLNEAMACGIFPIVTDIAANTQWITHQENGFLVAINDVVQLADLILESYNHYSEWSEKSFKINQKIIHEKADWHKNLKIVENKYMLLTNGQ